MKNRLTHNIGLKIISIIVAALLWLTIMNIDDPTITTTFYSIPVQIINEEVVTSRGYEYSIESGEKIDVRVKGKRSIVDNLTEADFAAQADFNSFNSMYMATITVECVSEYADQLEVSTRTETMAVKLEDQDTQPFSVRIVQQGTVKEGYYVFDSTVSSSLVQVTGSLTQIAAVKEVIAEVNIEDKMETFTEEVSLVAYDSEGNAIDPKKITFSHDSLEVTIGICPTKEVGISVVTEGEPAEGYYVDKVEFAPDTVLIAAEQSKLNLIRMIEIPCDISDAAGDLEFQINLEDYLAEKYEDTLTLVDEDITVGVIVSVKEMANKQINLSSTDVEVRNLADNLTYTIYSMWSSTVTVSGREEDIRGIVASDLDFYVDMKGCGAGTYSKQLMSDYRGDIIIDMGSVMVRLAEQNFAE